MGYNYKTTSYKVDSSNLWSFRGRCGIVNLIAYLVSKCIYAFVSLLNRVSAHINKKEVDMVHVQVRKIFSSPTNRWWQIKTDSSSPQTVHKYNKCLNLVQKWRPCINSFSFETFYLCLLMLILNAGQRPLRSAPVLSVALMLTMASLIVFQKVINSMCIWYFLFAAVMVCIMWQRLCCCYVGVLWPFASCYFGRCQFT